jgi:hypothetical protein
MICLDIFLHAAIAIARSSGLSILTLQFVDVDLETRQPAALSAGNPSAAGRVTFLVQFIDWLMAPPYRPPRRHPDHWSLLKRAMGSYGGYKYAACRRKSGRVSKHA